MVNRFYRIVLVKEHTENRIQALPIAVFDDLCRVFAPDSHMDDYSEEARKLYNNLWRRRRAVIRGQVLTMTETTI